MKRKNSLIKSFTCVIFCFLLIIGTVLNKPYISTCSQKVFSQLSSLPGSLGSVTVGAQPSENEDVYNITGYGNGGYTSFVDTNTPTDIEELKKQAEELFKGYTKAGSIKTVQMGATGKTLVYGRVELDNKTDAQISLKKLLSEKPDYKKITKDEPYILIYHTHSTEGYEMLDLGWYAKEYNSRTKDKSKNMIRVGDEITRVLQEAGFNVIHDRNIYDESYNGAYSRSREAVEGYLKKYPSIQITLDVHRDAIHYDDNVKCKPTAEINGKKAAQVMIVTGCEGDGVTNFPEWYKNLAFATHLQSVCEERFNGLMRPVFFCNRKYNMDLTTCSLLLEFGTDANTLEEAVYSAQLIADSLVAMLST